jgi:mRNA interferase MazF
MILCQMTSQNLSDNYAILVTASDFVSGGLRQNGNVRPNRLFTADSNIILYRVGSLDVAKLQEVIAVIVQILNS